MLGQIKLLLAGGALATLPLLSFSRANDSVEPPQNALSVQDPAAAATAQVGGTEVFETRWAFAAIQYTNGKGETVEVPARSLKKLWILMREAGDPILEILYENTDYSLVVAKDFHIIRRSGTLSTIDVPVARTRIGGMGFPKFK